VFGRRRLRLLSTGRSLLIGSGNTSAFVGTNPTGGLITSGLPSSVPEWMAHLSLRRQFRVDTRPGTTGDSVVLKQDYIPFIKSQPIT
jgi:hypothetical protein